MEGDGYGRETVLRSACGEEEQACDQPELESEVCGTRSGEGEFEECWVYGKGDAGSERVRWGQGRVKALIESGKRRTRRELSEFLGKRSSERESTVFVGDA